MIKISYEALADVFLLLNHQDQGALDIFESKIRALPTTDFPLPPEPVGDIPKPSDSKNFIIAVLKTLVTGVVTEIGKQAVIEFIKFLLKT